MKIGKVETDLLKQHIFDQITYKHPDVLVGSSIGEDCAVVSFGDDNLIITTDPITGTAHEIGSLCVDIVCNDIASNGAKPMALLLTILLPEGTSQETLLAIMSDASKRAAELEVEIIGGHTEVTSAVNRIVLSATAIAKQPKALMIHNRKAKPGDVILMTKWVAPEGTGILAYEKADELASVLSFEQLKSAKADLRATSVVADGVLAGRFLPHAMHDITEGGLLGAVYELCEASALGCAIDSAKLPLRDVTRLICDHFKIDPLKLISSGSMLILIEEAKRDRILEAFKLEGIPCTAIGIMTEASEKWLHTEDGRIPIEAPQSDALYEVIK